MQQIGQKGEVAQGVARVPLSGGGEGRSYGGGSVS